MKESIFDKEMKDPSFQAVYKKVATKLKVNGTFESVQGEGRYTGFPVLFIRLSGCTRKCSFCDTKYHIQNKQLSVAQLIKIIERSKMSTVVWTGGEPLLQLPAIQEVIKGTSVTKDHHIETNGDLIKKKGDLRNLNLFKGLIYYFEYVCISPKEKKVAKRISGLRDAFLSSIRKKIDIKVVTDLDKVGKDMVKYATTLMPLTTYNKSKDQKIRQKVWSYCIKKNLNYSARIHAMIWGNKKRV